MAKLFSRRTAAIVAVAAASMLVLSACSKSDSGSRVLPKRLRLSV
jgi:fructose transport system substrate-binding protein